MSAAKPTPTPGPWIWDKDLSDGGAPVIVAHTGRSGRLRRIAKVFFDNGSDDPEVYDNARLIATAPETAAERDRLRAALDLAAVRLEICADRMRGCGRHELVTEVEDFAAHARAVLVKAREAR